MLDNSGGTLGQKDQQSSSVDPSVRPIRLDAMAALSAIGSAMRTVLPNSADPSSLFGIMQNAHVVPSMSSTVASGMMSIVVLFEHPEVELRYDGAAGASSIVRALPDGFRFHGTIGRQPSIPDKSFVSSLLED